jgi:hypothetical protein
VSIPRYANCNCGVTFRTHGNKTGHCSGCHRTFTGIKAFDRHQTIDVGRVTCHDPASLYTEADPPDELYARREEDGVTYWTLAQTAEQAAHWASLAVQRSTQRQISDQDSEGDSIDDPDDEEAA